MSDKLARVSSISILLAHIAIRSIQDFSLVLNCTKTSPLASSDRRLVDGRSRLQNGQWIHNKQGITSSNKYQRMTVQRGYRIAGGISTTSAWRATTESSRVLIDQCTMHSLCQPPLGHCPMFACTVAGGRPISFSFPPGRLFWGTRIHHSCCKMKYKM